MKPGFPALVGAVVGFVIGVFLVTGASVSADKRAAEAGITVIGSKAYRLVPLEPRP